MPDHRKHRGAHARDPQLFSDEARPVLARATFELSWLLGRGFSDVAALKLVGDHHQLQERQRRAVMRSACPLGVEEARQAATGPGEGQVVVDGFNLLITIEAALSGGVLLRGRDGWLRDLASVHGSYRRVEETEEALDRLVAALGDAQVTWILDRPVSNSGRTAVAIRNRGHIVLLEEQADAALVRAAAEGAALATGDGPLMDRAVAAGGRLIDLAGAVTAALPSPWIVDLHAPD
ncbi:MAG: DUF434 domain-containing protein [Alphaproteobacteria bacterium]|nr:DUF434 domain-containing protein [Alphaproteobacteria bacterium]